MHFTVTVGDAVVFLPRGVVLDAWFMNQENELRDFSLVAAC